MKRKNGWVPDRGNSLLRSLSHGRAALIILGLSLLANFNYTEADDWTRTLGYNYDLFGYNMKIHTLYLGSSPGLDTGEMENMKDIKVMNEVEEGTAAKEEGMAGKEEVMAGTEEGGERTQGEGPEEGVRQICDLRSAGQSMKESYYLLGKAYRRYRLSCVYLCREYDRSPEQEAGEGTRIQGSEPTETELYLQKIISYCEEKGIRLIMTESRDQFSAFFSKC